MSSVPHAFIFKQLIRIQDSSFQYFHTLDHPISDIVSSTPNRVTWVLYLATVTHNHYYINLSELTTNEPPLPSSILTIEDLISNYLTPEHIYSYHETKYKFNKFFQYLNIDDIHKAPTYSGYSSINDDIISVIDLPTYPDLHIAIEDFNLFNCIPMFDNRLFSCTWRNNAVIIDRGTTRVYDKSLTGFVYIPSSDIKMFPLSEVMLHPTLLDTEPLMDEYIPLVVLDGRLIYADNSIYSYNSTYHTLTFNETLIDNDPAFATYDEDIAKYSSFLILVKCSNISHIHMTTINESLNVFNINSSSIDEDPSTLFCQSKTTHDIHPFVSLISNFKSIHDSVVHTKTHFRFEHNDIPTPVEIYQLAITS